MQLGAWPASLAEHSLDDVLTMLNDAGIEAIELNCGRYGPSPFLEATEAVDDTGIQSDLLERTGWAGIEVAALGCYNNPLHPDSDQAQEADRELRAAIRLADQIDVDVVTCMSGLPGGAPDDVTPTWVTAPWPTEHREAYEYQWAVAEEYWEEVEAFAAEHGIELAIEIHLNMLVHTPLDVLRLREVTGEHLGANLDPSHLYPQSIDVIESTVALAEEDALTYIHLKDSRTLDRNARLRGMLDVTPWQDRAERAWTFCRPGRGHDPLHWAEFFDTLRAVDYAGCLTIQHFHGDVEGPEAGIRKTARFVRDHL